jgi:hypothetical protein
MNVSRSLTFLWTPASVSLSVAAVLFAAVVCVAAVRRSGYRPAYVGLEGLRFVVVCIAVVLLNQPEWVEEFRPEGKPSVAVLWDASRSMDTCDVVRPGGTRSAPLSRREVIAPLADAASWSSVAGRFTIGIQSFSPSPSSSGTELYEPLSQAPDKFHNLRAIVLASDGDWNTGKPPVQAADLLRQKGIPIFAVTVGSPTRLPDIEVLSLDAPTFGVVGKSVRIPFTIESSLPREYVTTVTLRTSSGDELSKEVHIAPMGRTSDSLLWKPKAIGDFTATLDVPPNADETLVDNNRRTAPISVREEKLKVLVVESYPRWEYRYLRNALSRDPGVEVSCLLFHPGLGKSGGGNKDYIKQFPARLDELSKYDVVFLGDVGVGDGQLTSDQCRLLKGLVERQASGLVFMPGWEGREFSLFDTELGDLCPVVLDAAQPNGWGLRIPSHFELTDLGRRSLLTKLADSEDDNSEVWEGLPGFQWYAPVQRAKAGTEVLCVHKDVSNEFGRIPLLVTRTFGAGKVLFMGTDGAWRWRKGVEDKYHYRFWGQVVRWMAYQRNMAKGETMRLFYVPDQPQLHQTLTFDANVMEKSGEPLHSGRVTARITAPSGASETVRLASGGEEWGMFTGRFTPKEPGKHQIDLSCQETGAKLAASFFVQGEAVERPGKPARPEVLEELARVTEGKMVTVDQLQQVIQSLASLPDPPPMIRRSPLWSHPLPAACLVALLGLFWSLRKLIGLI